MVRRSFCAWIHRVRSCSGSKLAPTRSDLGLRAIMAALVAATGPAKDSGIAEARSRGSRDGGSKNVEWRRRTR
jgi:hypothetical protein